MDQDFRDAVVSIIDQYMRDNIHTSAPAKVGNVSENFTAELTPDLKVTTDDDREVPYPNYIVNNRLDVLVTIFDSLLGGRAKDNHNFCGGTGSMLSFAPDGSAYPCIRYAPISIGEEKSKKVRFGSVYDGLYTTDSQRKAKAELDAITLTSQSEQKCIDCPVSAGCGWCSGLNYEMYGTANKRFTGICWAHKARVLASAYYHNRRYIEIGDCLPIKAELPKDDALEILPAADYEEFLKIERAALLKFADENGIG